MFSFLGGPMIKECSAINNTPRPLRTFEVKDRAGDVEVVAANYFTIEQGWVSFCVGGPYDQPVITAFYEPLSYRDITQ